MSPTAALSALSKLTKQEANDLDHFDAFRAEIEAESNHRGAAILIVTNVELALDYTLRAYLNRTRTKMLLGIDRPLGGLRNKILVAYAIEIFGDETFHNLESMRHIRNAFAHCNIPINFGTKEVKDVCDAMIPPKLLPPHVMGAEKEDISVLSGLQRFRKFGDWTAHNLLSLSMFRPTKMRRSVIDAHGLKLGHPYVELVAIAAPMP